MLPARLYSGTYKVVIAEVMRSEVPLAQSRKIQAVHENVSFERALELLPKPGDPRDALSSLEASITDISTYTIVLVYRPGGTEVWQGAPYPALPKPPVLSRWQRFLSTFQ